MVFLVFQAHDTSLQAKVAFVTEVAGLCFGGPYALPRLSLSLSKSEIGYSLLDELGFRSGSGQFFFWLDAGMPRVLGLISLSL